MKINELTAGKKATIEGVITQKSKARAVEVEGKPVLTQSSTLKDETGEIVLSLWGEDTNIPEGTKVLVENGFVKDYKGILQFSAGKFGKIKTIQDIKLPEVQKVQPPANIVKESSDGVIKHEELMAHIKEIEKFVAEDYDTTIPKIEHIIETLARIEKKIDTIAKKAGITEGTEFVKASEI